MLRGPGNGGKPKTGPRSRPIPCEESTATKDHTETDINLTRSDEDGAGDPDAILFLSPPFLYTLKASGSEFGAGIKDAVERGWLKLHESGTYVRLLKTEAAN